MRRMHFPRRAWPGIILIGLVLVGVLPAGCGGNAPAANPSAAETTAAGPIALPAIPTQTANGGRLKVVATTSILGDVVRQIGGDTINLAVLMQPGQDPHSYTPGAADLVAAADSDLIFVNGWDLEEGLVDDLATIGGDAILVPVSAGITPRVVGESGEHGPVDPHVWQDVANVMAWAGTIREVLSAADPANAAIYEANVATYRTALEELDGELRATLGGIPAGQRVLVTNHDNLGYFAAAYDFDVVGTVIPSASTLAEPTAGALAELVEVMESAGICTLIIEPTAGEQTARMLERELAGCDGVGLVSLYTDALGAAGSGADSYIGMMRANAVALVEGLR